MAASKIKLTRPGKILWAEFMEPVGLSAYALAKALGKVLGVSRQALNNLVNKKAGISPEMAIRLDEVFGGTAEAWLALQAAYDLAQARTKPLAIEVKRYVPKSRNVRLRAA